MKVLMDNLGDLAGLDMVLLRQAGFDPEAEPVHGGSTARPAWIDAIARRAAGLFVAGAAPAAERRAMPPLSTARKPSGTA